MKHSTAWRAFERRAAALLGGIRNAFSGAAPSLTGTRADIRHGYLFPECKYRRKHAVVSIWDEARAKADREHKVPLVVLAENGRRGYWFVVYSGDLERLARYGKIDDLPIFQKADA